MKRVTASDARKNWFRLLDEVVDGEVVCIERGGRRVLLQRESAPGVVEPCPDYSCILTVPDAAHAHRWSWDWDGQEAEILLSREQDDV